MLEQRHHSAREESSRGQQKATDGSTLEQSAVEIRGGENMTVEESLWKLKEQRATKDSRGR